jgi:hypothetical protein
MKSFNPGFLRRGCPSRDPHIPIPLALGTCTLDAYLHEDILNVDPTNSAPQCSNKKAKHKTRIGAPLNVLIYSIGQFGVARLSCQQFYHHNVRLSLVQITFFIGSMISSLLIQASNWYLRSRIYFCRSHFLGCFFHCRNQLSSRSLAAPMPPNSQTSQFKCC